MCCYKSSSSIFNCPAILLSVEICPSLLIILLSLPYQPLPAHITPVVAACPATYQNPFNSRPCTAVCVEIVSVAQGSSWTVTSVSLYPGVAALTMATVTTATRLSGQITALSCVCVTPTCTRHCAIWILVAHSARWHQELCAVLSADMHIHFSTHSNLWPLTMIFMIAVGTI